MKHQGNINLQQAIDHISKALLLVLGLLAFSSMAFADGEVKFKGKISASETDLTNAVIVVEINGEACALAELYSNGAFSFDLPVGAQAVLIVHKNGFTPKEVLIDTRNAWVTKRAKRKNKKIEFLVELMPRSFEDDLVYAAPVGQISFLNGSGLMKVELDHRMVEAPHVLASEE